MEGQAIMRELPTSGRPLGPPPRPSPEATYDLAWRYGKDLARLHMVDPEKLFFFWELTDETVQRARGRKGGLAARLQRIDAAPRTVELSPSVSAVGNWYFESEPLARYQAEVGWLSPDGRFEPWLVSNAIDTPRMTPNVTGEVVWRTRKSMTTRSAPRGENVLGPEEHPSERPSGAASAAGARRRLAAREVSRQAWSGSTAAWSRTAVPRAPAGGAGGAEPPHAKGAEK